MAPPTTDDDVKTIIVKEQSNVGLWKSLAIILGAIVVLLVTDAVEINIAQHPSINRPPALPSMSSSHATAVQDHDVLAAAAKVVYKTKPPKPAKPEAPKPTPEADGSKDAGKEQGKPKEEAAPVESPTKAPAKAKSNSVPSATPATFPVNPDIPDYNNPKIEIPKGVTAYGDFATSTTTDKHIYLRRGQPLTEKERNAQLQEWGQWNLVDDKREKRPQKDFYKEFDNRDVPGNKFPNNAWQRDSEYLGQFLPESIALVERAMKAILAEYGYKVESDDQLQEQIDKIFQIELLDTTEGEEDLEFKKGQGGRPSMSKGGWFVKKGWMGVQRRILHAIMTEDKFVVAMGGHSSSAGHGNHFSQSWTLQIQWILEAVFARLGVRHVSRNFGNGGLGTIQNSMGAGNLYGPDIDILSWDSGMTEGASRDIEAFWTQGLLGGTKVPAIFSLGLNDKWMTEIGADFGFLGTGKAGLIEGKSFDDIKGMPFAQQYVSCSKEMTSICRDNEYRGVCWIDRPDGFSPAAEQKPAPGGRAKWHPGDRIHQLQGRVFTFGILQALREALQQWQDAPDFILPDDAWHVTKHYDNIRSNVAKTPSEACLEGFESRGMAAICKHPIRARTEFTPRAYPGLSNIRTLMFPDMRKEVGAAPDPSYMWPDVFNPNLHPPKGEIDVLNVVEAGSDFQPTLNPDYPLTYYEPPKFSGKPKLDSGKGWYLMTDAGDQYCDGSVDSWCKRGDANDCMLYGHNDGRNGILFDGVSGWVNLLVPKVKHGYISVRLETWHPSNPKSDAEAEVDAKTDRVLRRQDYGQDFLPQSNDLSPEELSWNLEWNSTLLERSASRSLRQVSQRGLRKKKAAELEDDFKFEFAIDGKTTSWNKEQFLDNDQVVQRVVEVFVLLNDENYSNGGEKDVQVSIRQIQTAAQPQRAFSLSHVYWA